MPVLQHRCQVGGSDKSVVRWIEVVIEDVVDEKEGSAMVAW